MWQQPRAVLCGSFRRDPTGLQRLFHELEATGCRILSPLSLDFRDTKQAFVRTENEDDITADELERFHLRAIREADFVMVHAPGGHIGRSGAFEIGYATALHKPVYTKTAVSDEMLACQVRSVSSVFEIREALEAAASNASMRYTR